MKLIFIPFFVFTFFYSRAQNTFIRNHGFEALKVSARDFVTEDSLHYYALWSYSSQNGGGGNKSYYRLGKYSKLGQVVSTSELQSNLYRPYLWKCHKISGSELTCLIDESRPVVPYKSKVFSYNYDGNTNWSSSDSLIITDFYPLNPKSFFGCGFFSDVTDSLTMNIFIGDLDSGKTQNLVYFRKMSYFNIPDSHIVRMNSVMCVSENGFLMLSDYTDSTKYIYHFDKNLNYISNWRISSNAKCFLQNDSLLLINSEEDKSNFLLLYDIYGSLKWKLDIRNFTDETYYPEKVFIENSTINLLSHHISPSSNYRQLTILGFDGQVLGKYKFSPQDENNFAPRGICRTIDRGFLFNMYGYTTDYDGFLVKADSCLNAVGLPNTLYSFSKIENPDCFQANSTYEFEASILKYKIYPNPTSSTLTLELNTNQTVNYTLQNLNGQILQQGSFERSTQISTSNLANSIYFLQIKGNGILETRKIVVQR
ncbi:MAG: T9SS type A sorting domain-containing protein [Flavobacteriales bacterium]|nr:T9SS type A sorting domain-containing protein [Flavobacteriales bacterium]